MVDKCKELDKNIDKTSEVIRNKNVDLINKNMYLLEEVWRLNQENKALRYKIALVGYNNDQIIRIADNQSFFGYNEIYHIAQDTEAIISHEDILNEQKKGD